jgi:hypothetical protein
VKPLVWVAWLAGTVAVAAALAWLISPLLMAIAEMIA